MSVQSVNGIGKTIIRQVASKKSAANPKEWSFTCADESGLFEEIRGVGAKNSCSGFHSKRNDNSDFFLDALA